ncbi:Uncharacterised protein [Raoultella terrigena]|uniref:Uncharacterized protein n=1 Tax=Raoultella terrigena TaxID=577 RepID=A0A4U9D0M3_RAOTE|nr:Uncharacterised protein [Raoultella terrigena]
MAPAIGVIFCSITAISLAYRELIFFPLMLVIDQSEREIEHRTAFLHAVIHHVDGLHEDPVAVGLFLQIFLHVFDLRPSSTTW